jgi:hypothetical protein
VFFLFGLLADQNAALRRGEAAYRRNEQVQSAMATQHTPSPPLMTQPPGSVMPDDVDHPAGVTGDASPLEAQAR